MEAGFPKVTTLWQGPSLTERPGQPTDRDARHHMVSARESQESLGRSAAAILPALTPPR